MMGLSAISTITINCVFLLLLVCASLESAHGFVVTPSRSARKAISISQRSQTASDESSLTLFSPCKINLFLRIIRKRDDGFHDLASLFQAVGFGDTLELQLLASESSDDTFDCNMEGVPTDSSNLVLRALQLMREKTGLKDTFFSANLIKECPAQAGLGGGSANAATAMFGANELMGNPATLEQMVDWSAELGSDITFFLSFGTAYCTGRGEILTPIDPPLKDGTPLVICKPNVGLSTPKVFQSLDYSKLSQKDPQELLNDFTSAASVEQVSAESYINDLEPPAFVNLPELEQLKHDLERVDGFHHVRMSGSGTSIFCIGRPNDEAAFQKEFGQRSDLQIFYSEFISRPKDGWYERPTADSKQEEVVA